VIAIRHAESPDLRRVRARLEGAPKLLERGPLGVLYAIVDQVVDEYEPVVEGLGNDIEEIEFQLFSGDRAVAKRIYDLAGEVMELQRAIRPLTTILATLRDDLRSAHHEDPHALELRRSFRDVLDHVVSITEKAEEFRQTLSNALMTHTTLVAQQQNDEMRLLTETSLRQAEQAKKISGWAAIIFAPSLVAAVYGMNFTVMPWLSSPWGFAIAIVIMVAFALALYLVFRTRHWL
jgi:magnesium transporter